MKQGLILGVYFMRVDLNLNNRQQSFGFIRLEKGYDLLNEISKMHSNKQKLFQETFDILELKLAKEAKDGKYIIDKMTPAKADYVKTGSYKVNYKNSANGTVEEKTFPTYSPEDLSLQIEGQDRAAGFYMNPNEKSDNLAAWILNTFNKLSEKLI